MRFFPLITFCGAKHESRNFMFYNYCQLVLLAADAAVVVVVVVIVSEEGGEDT